MAVTLMFCLLMLVSLVSSGTLECDYCMQKVKEVDDFLAANGTVTDIEELATIICEVDDAGGQCEGPWDSWQCQQVCELAVKTFEPMVDYLVIRYIDPQLICYNIENNTLGCDKPVIPDPTPVPNVIYDNQTRQHHNISTQYGYILQIPGPQFSHPIIV